MHDLSEKSCAVTQEALVSFFQSACKKPEECKIGIEYETIPFYPENLEKIPPYEGEKGIGALLEAIGREPRYVWQPVYDGKHLIGLKEKKENYIISLEPGGQFEFSGSPFDTVHKIKEQTELFFNLLKPIAQSLGINLLALGANPKWKTQDIPRMPKSRYAIMERFMPKAGTQGLDMMFRTCTIHANLDFSSEADMRRKMQVSLKLQPLASALFANSPFTEGKPNHMQSWRSSIWEDTDNKRCKVPERFFSPHLGFEDYVEWALDIPMYFLVRKGKYHDMTSVTFRKFMEGKAQDRHPCEIATIQDWENHLSTLFPNVRLKKCLELRGADSGSKKMVFALAALWTGLLYNEKSLGDAEILTKDWTFEEISAVGKSVPEKALRTPFRKKTLHDLAKEVLGIAHAGLKERQRISGDGSNESIYLAPLDEIVASGLTEAEKLINLFKKEWHNTVQPVFKTHSILEDSP